MIQGVDYSEGRPDLTKLGGKAFVCRYLSGARVAGNDGKDLGQGERDEILSHGLAIVLVWETDGRTGPLAGASGGKSDATAAVAEAQWLGAPAGTCLYFAVDFQATSANAASLEAYATAVSTVCHSAGYRSGIYGGLATEQYDKGLVDCLWQTYAWSAGQWEPTAVIQQYQNGVTLAGASVDLDQATSVDYGQWAVAPPVSAGSQHTAGGTMLAPRNDGSGILDAFFVDNDNLAVATFSILADGSTDAPYVINPSPVSRILGASWQGTAVLTVVVRGTDSAVYIIRFANSKWGGYSAVGNGSGSSILTP